MGFSMARYAVATVALFFTITLYVHKRVGLPHNGKRTVDLSSLQRLKNTQEQREFLAWYAAGLEAPWDLRQPQPYIMKAKEQGLFLGEILDMGCGLGDNAIYLGKRGHKVTSVDFSTHAIREAEHRLSTSGEEALGNVKFVVGNALDLEPVLKDQQFDTVLDSALLHVFNDEQQRQYVASLAPHLKRGGRLLLLVMSDLNPPENWRGPNLMALEDFDRLFNAETGWHVASVQPAKYRLPERYLNHGKAYAWFAVILRL